MQKRNAAKTVYNANILLEEDTLNRLEAGSDALIWTEGEPDCHAVLLSGYDTCISVPTVLRRLATNGKLIHVPDDDRDIDPEDDDKFSLMGRLMDSLQRVKHHIIAVDATNLAAGSRRSWCGASRPAISA
jgi:twinkle protein